MLGPAALVARLPQGPADQPPGQDVAARRAAAPDQILDSGEVPYPGGGDEGRCAGSGLLVDGGEVWGRPGGCRSASAEGCAGGVCELGRCYHFFLSVPGSLPGMALA
nr:MAG TPA: hypothetical protein [Caudoviricetes sp.]